MENHVPEKLERYYVPTMWHSTGKNELHKEYLDALKTDDDLQNIDRRLERAVWKQIEYIWGGKPEIYVTEFGEIGFKHLDRLSKEKQKAISHIYATYRDGTYQRHQFSDSPFNKKVDAESYCNWLEQALDTYLYTMPFKQILGLSDFNREGNVTFQLTNAFSQHNRFDELARANAGLGDYCINQIKYTLEHYLQPYIILSILGTDIHVMDLTNYKPYLVCTTRSGDTIAASLYSKELFYVGPNTVSLIGNSYEHLFRQLKLPIQTVINSTLKVMDSNMLPSEGLLDEHSFNKQLVKKISKAAESEGFEKAKKITKTTKWFND